ncbi:hypothetical protein AQUSIP_01680 [Aquicella siphonis]|uniref:Uncharacterized protein n=1 Tax=Aquicella siphonis TaxID=254247 RepID=A0A5E4PDN2_9COXI|nr:hypothetical protein [Aquicella siphonis]VVC74894.1 hypothetical protein AQUSIP_01680 [Aquicella siphonis]
MKVFYRRPVSPQFSNLPSRPDPASRYPKWVFAIVFLGVAAWAVYHHYEYAPAPPLPPGVMVNEEPTQTALEDGASFEINGYQIKPVAAFSLRARVLGIHFYDSDREAELSPADLALGWGLMSDSSILDHIKITQHDRWYFWKYEEKLPVNDAYIIEHSGNMHLLPASKQVQEVLQAVRENNIISLEGYLVNVADGKGYQWNTSLSRKDTGNHSCEVIWVENLVIEK